ncbi:MAG: hypothetical protein U9R48_07575 [Chloroflexota bacterium]|nr:hypothetical protein [Chloroflexota bacterium]
MTNHEPVLWIAIALGLLFAGMFLGQTFQEPPQDIPQSSFRHWFWEGRSLDLIVQVGLIFVGALGISALLPRGREDEPE